MSTADAIPAGGTAAPQHGSRARARRRWIGWLVFAAAGGVAAALIIRHATERPARAPPAPHPVPVTTIAARTGDIGVYVEALGTVTPVYTVSITSRVQGQIVAVNYWEGQAVHTGDSLIEIDSRPFEAALAQARGQLAHDRAVLKQARIDLQRYQVAWDRNAIARQQLEDQEQIVRQDRGTVKMDEGTVAAAEVNLEYCHIRSPIDGRVGLRLVDPGNMVQANSTATLVTVAQFEPITVIFNVSEDALPEIQDSLRHGPPMTVDAFDRTNARRLSTGTLLTLDNMIDPTTGTIRLRATFANRDDALFPSQFVNARLLVRMQRGATLIPASAVQRNGRGAFVYVIANDTAEMRSIKEGTTDGQVTAVEGVRLGEIVATAGFDKLQANVKVAIREAPDAGMPQQTPPAGADP